MNAYGVQSVDDMPMDPRMGEYADPSWSRAEFAIAEAMTWVREWSWDKDPHGYCHDRNILIGLLREIERLRAAGVAPEGQETP